jgi:hypothetical protein
MASKILTPQQLSGEEPISLKALGLESIDQKNLEPENTAMKHAITYATERKLPGFVVSFTSRRRSTQLTVVRIKKFGIPVQHPQCVRHVSDGYYAMTSNF